MSFCGHCGYLLPPNSARCPRCGTLVEPADKTQAASSDMPTIHSQSGNMPSEDAGEYYPQPSSSQQEATQVAGNNNYATNLDPASGPYHTANAFEPTVTPHGPAGSFYPPQTPPYASFPASSDNNAALQRGETSYPGFSTAPTIDYPENSSSPPTNTTSKKAPVALILAIVAFILAASLTTMLLLARPGILQQILHPGTTTSTTTPVVTAPPTTIATRPPEQQARIVIEQYFNYINRKEYQRAYNLWNPPPSSYNDFVNGFVHTRHDYIKLGTITQQNDGTVQIPIVITALTDTGTQEIFSGYYVVGQQPDGSWKIIGAKINQGTGS